MAHIAGRFMTGALTRIVLVLIALALLAVACGDEVTPTPNPTATPTAAPAATATATLTPSPTATPAPTPSPTPTPSPFPLTITGDNGKQITLQESPERIVAIDSAAVEILFALGVGERVVGTHNFVDYPPETADIERIGSAFALNLEKIAELEPDLIYIFFEAPVADLENLGAPVLYLDLPGTLEEVADNIRFWGDIVDRSDEAEMLAKEFEAALEALEQRVAGITEGPRIYHDEAPGLWTTGSGSLAHEIYAFLKAENVFADMSGYNQVSPEEFVARDPEVIISVYEEGRESFVSNPAFNDVSAVKSDRIAVMDGSLLSVPGLRLMQGIEIVAMALYPDLFQ